MKTGTSITVKAKGDFGFSPALGKNIIKGDEYTMDEGDWGAELFERPATDWLSPAERETAAKKKPKGGSK